MQRACLTSPCAPFCRCLLPLQLPLLTHAVGAFELSPAVDIKAGDRLAITQPDATQAGYVVAAVEKVESVEADGLYLPVIEHPYLVVDGVVMPL